ncbi:PAS domain-containing protein [Sorangium sp. So ce1024]|uniref:PAS domain-containing protein n=1 Tax=Sorangium sp. So ce1024 TaxID=3133327 RepID=UPI003EFD36AC
MREAPPPPPSEPPIRDELEELRDELRQKALPGERLIDTHRRLVGESLERRWRADLLEQIAECLPINIFAKDSEHRYVLANRNVSKLAGRESSELIGKTDFDLGPERAARVIRASDERVLAKGGMLVEELELESDAGEKRQVLVGKTLVRSGQSDEQVLIGFSIDITENKRVERELRDKIALIEQQRAVIRALSTPIIEVWDRVLTVPMLGALDGARAGVVMEDLLADVSRRGARFAILDLTGVEAMDTDTAAHLFRLVQAIRLLGAEGIITGVPPSGAQAMVALGVDLKGITTLASLREGLSYCMRRMRARAA